MMVNISHKLSTALFIFISVVRIEWLHAKASMERFEEEVCLVKAESVEIRSRFEIEHKKAMNYRLASVSS